MVKMVDPKGQIARAKAKMSIACSVRQSKYCDEIISLRLQGHAYRKIEDWLMTQGREHHIPAATLCRNLQRGLGEAQDFMPAYEELAEKNGGTIPLDPQRTLSGQALIQRTRIDYMVRQEAERRKTRPGYSNSRIRQEMETYLQLVLAAAKYDEESKEKDAVNPENSTLTLDAEERIAEMILSGDIAMPGMSKPKLIVVK